MVIRSKQSGWATIRLNHIKDMIQFEYAIKRVHFDLTRFSSSSKGRLSSTLLLGMGLTATIMPWIKHKRKKEVVRRQRSKCAPLNKCYRIIYHVKIRLNL